MSADGEEPFVAMEYVAGISLRDMLEATPTGLPVEIALVIAIDTLRGSHGTRTG